MRLSWPKNDARKSRAFASKGGPDRLAPTLSPLHQAHSSAPPPSRTRPLQPAAARRGDLVMPLPWRATKLTFAHSSPLRTRPSLEQLASFQLSSSSLWKWRRIVAARDRRVTVAITSQQQQCSHPICPCRSYPSDASEHRRDPRTDVMTLPKGTLPGTAAGEDSPTSQCRL